MRGQRNAVSKHTMKTKPTYHAQAVEILNKPGRYAVLRQWTNGGQILRDESTGDGYTLEEATQLASQHKSLGNQCKSSNCRIVS